MRLAQRQSDGQPLREHLLAAAHLSGQAAPELQATPPVGGAGLWATYCALSGARPASFGGALPVPPSEVLAWCSLRGVRLTPWESDTLQAMDRAALAVLAEQSERKAKKGAPQ